MVIEARHDPQVNPNDSPVKQLLKRYEHALQLKDQWKSIFEECYEYALPQMKVFLVNSQAEEEQKRYLMKLL